MSPQAVWEHFAHGADIGVRGIARTREAAFEQAAIALSAVVTDPSTIRDAEATPVHCQAPDGGLLLVDWLNEVVYEMAVGRRLFRRFDVSIQDENGTLTLDAVAWGEPVDRIRHEPAVEVKGATQTELRVERRPDGAWVAQCVVDV